MTGRSPDITGFGALNVDYIASASRLSERAQEDVTESTARFEWNREGPVSEEVITQAMRNLGAASLSCSLGGSAWLTIFSLAQMRTGLRLAYIGMLGRIETPGVSFIEQMDELAIAHDHVGRAPEQLCGLCLSYIDDTDRVMLTHPGANYDMHRYIKVNFDALASYIAGTKCVHVTSFLDPQTPGQVRRVLEAAKQLNPRLCVSFDPGFDWADNPSEDIEGILAVTDLLFLNYREFKALGKYYYGEPDQVVADRILARCGDGCVVFVTKRYDLAESFQTGDDAVAARVYRIRTPAGKSDLEDATGAGDVFAAAVLSSLFSSSLKVGLGAYLGSALARAKVTRTSAGDLELPDLSGGILERAETTYGSGPAPSGVFLVHHRSPYRDRVRKFIETDCGLPVHEITSADIVTPEFAASLPGRVRECGFAVCLLGKDEAMMDGRARADQNIVYQAGFFQGRYGFGRVAMLTEEGCDGFSNIAGIVRLDFTAPRVDSTFIELRGMLQREGLLPASRQDT